MKLCLYWHSYLLLWALIRRLMDVVRSSSLERIRSIISTLQTQSHTFFTYSGGSSGISIALSWFPIILLSQITQNKYQSFLCICLHHLHSHSSVGFSSGLVMSSKYPSFTSCSITDSSSLYCLLLFFIIINLYYRKKIFPSESVKFLFATLTTRSDIWMVYSILSCSTRERIPISNYSTSENF